MLPVKPLWTPDWFKQPRFSCRLHRLWHVWLWRGAQSCYSVREPHPPVQVWYLVRWVNDLITFSPMLRKIWIVPRAENMLYAMLERPVSRIRLKCSCVWFVILELSAPSCINAYYLWHSGCREWLQSIQPLLRGLGILGMCYLSVSGFSTHHFYRSICLRCDVVKKKIMLVLCSFFFKKWMYIILSKWINYWNTYFMDNSQC